MSKSNLIKNFINSNMNIDIALQNLMVILNEFNNEDLMNWVRKELTGYGVNDEIPKYRKLKGLVMANFIVGHLQYSGQRFPISHLEEELKEGLETVIMYSSIATLMKSINDDRGLMRPIPPEFYDKIQSGSNAHITNAYVKIDTTSITDLVYTVKTKVLDALLLLEKEFGNLDDLDIDTSAKTEEENNTIIEKLYITLYDNSITIGDNNEIKKSNLITHI